MVCHMRNSDNRCFCLRDTVNNIEGPCLKSQQFLQYRELPYDKAAMHVKRIDAFQLGEYGYSNSYVLEVSHGKKANHRKRRDPCGFFFLQGAIQAKYETHMFFRRLWVFY
jgi:hypothetical protein